MDFKILKVKLNGELRCYAYDKKAERWSRIDDAFLRRHWDDRYADLNERGREKSFRAFLEDSEIIRKLKVPDISTRKKHLFKGSEEQIKAKLSAGAETLLSFRGAFQDAAVGHELLGNLLAGAHAEAIYSAVGIPGFRLTLTVNGASADLTGVLTALERAAVPRRKFKKGKAKLKLNPVLDFGGGKKNLSDFCRFTVKVKHCGKLRDQASYADRPLLFLNGSSASLSSAEASTRSCTAIAVNCSVPEGWKACRIPIKSLAMLREDFPAVIEENKKAIAMVFALWRDSIDDEAEWAQSVVADAKQSITVTDGHYRSVSYDLREFQSAIRRQMVLRFACWAEECGFITAEIAASVSSEMERAFSPEPQQKTAIRKMEDPDVFKEIVGQMAADHADSILPEGQRFVKADKPFGCWRKIGETRYLVVLEENFSKAYLKACKAVGVDISFADQSNWGQKLQKALCLQAERSENEREELIKFDGSNNYRYRLDLFGTGRKDSHVVAIPAALVRSEP